MMNFPFAHVDNPVIRDALRIKPINKKTLLKRMVSLVGVVDVKVCDKLTGEKFVLVFGGFTDAAEHEIAIFDETSQTLSEHIAFPDLVLDHYGLHVANMIAIVADNMETKKAIAHRINVSMIVCAAHRFNLAVRQWIEPNMPIIKEMSSLMKRLKTRSGCDIEREEHEDDEANEVSSRDSSTGLRRIPLVYLIPSAGEQRKIAELLDEMTVFDVITTRLQRQDMTITTVRGTFDVVMEGHGAGIVKVQSGSEKTLLAAERKAVSRLLRSQHSTAPQPIDAPPTAFSKRNALRKALLLHGQEFRGIPAEEHERAYVETVMFYKLNRDIVTLGSVSVAIEDSDGAEYVVDSDDE
ncbi:hypothetical protein PHYSODRAFT_326704 [Phytophthora sojae]|uniref:DUF659 domain-containing protein n=1 Tax=Phytophthora sojae (strain P6497) TaxID=1094619 RepID=G4YY15_PHYSP|nr:hypothetical protein PHYSODRAFT_326704 [Phytophthora sojae]EGZ25718.1 hypothetical protein PHYSODRAFT_326704 [Phytophthora sojae]|eukprot:XP_009521006.1 hypothetical protein PHYSODRAFT_326704 [Phytophthora sojae]